MKASYPFVLALFAGFAGTAQAQISKDDMSSMKMPAPSQQATGVLTEAIVQKIDQAGGTIVLKHGDIPNLAMPAMTMGFDVADRKMLTQIKMGDKVRFHVEVVNGKPTVTHIVIAR
ncbi:copper-binding protein [Delftia acidovorans]|uniref:Copper-binding protein n=1 Tax=Delftia acidovorans TaxID=80866 RepID=A0AAJ2R2M1_DELAC|nr:copper-binding protein [Delftia acidovorans]MDX4954718.1 copper-binding protein [Delftia acidovorans]MDX4957353.1 copper-binding protein [Delftia acidovorans]